MSDITMCTNLDCPVKDNCYRTTAKRGYYQSVCDFTFEIVKGKVVCEYFWDNKDYKKIEI